MSQTAKKKLVVALLVALAIWPGLHFWLVKSYQLSPWRFFGWAMYCEPKLPIELKFFTRRDGANAPLVVGQGEEWADVRQHERDFLRQREIWGSLAAPDTLGAFLAQNAEGGDLVEVVVEHLALDRATAKIAAQQHRYTYRR